MNFRTFRFGFSTMARQLNPVHVINNTGSHHTGTVFFFHGSGATAEVTRCGIGAIMGNDFSFPHLKVVFPNAPLQPYTPLDGDVSNVWFDRLAISSSVPEHLPSIERISKDFAQLIKEENDKGIPNSRIIVGGFSMGGAMALYTGFKYNTSLAGVFAISSFLNEGSVVYEHLKTEKPATPELLQFHGGSDDLVPLKAGRDTFEMLKSLGVKGTFTVEKGLEHTCNRSEILNLYSWIYRILPNV